MDQGHNNSPTDSKKKDTTVSPHEQIRTLANSLPRELETLPRRQLIKYAGVAAFVLVFGGIAALHILGVITFGSFLSNVDYDPKQVVANVNDTTITRGEFEKRMNQIKTALTVQSGPMDAAAESKLRQDVLSEMINSKLLLQEAQKSGVTASDEVVESEYKRIIGMFGDEASLDGQLAAVGMTKDELRQNIRSERIIRTYLEANTEIKNVTASEGDIQQLYNEQYAKTEGAPKLSDVHDSIAQQVVQQKTGAIVQAYVAELRTKASIKTMLPTS